MKLLSHVCLAFTIAVTAGVARAEQVALSGAGYPIPSSSKAVVTLKNHETTAITCTIEAIGVVKANAGRGPVEGIARSYPIAKTIRENRAVDVEFDFRHYVDIMRNAWSDPSAILTTVSTGGQSLDFDCRRGLLSSDEQGLVRMRDVYGVDLLEDWNTSLQRLQPGDPVARHRGLSNILASFDAAIQISYAAAESGRTLARFPYSPKPGFDVARYTDVRPTDWYFEALHQVSGRWGLDLREPGSNEFRANSLLLKEDLQSMLAPMFGPSVRIPGSPQDAMSYADLASFLVKVLDAYSGMH